jgi:hypothetical protein
MAPDTGIARWAIYRGEADGIDWCVCPSPVVQGAVNGYARIPAGHPWAGRDRDTLRVDAPGGLTYGPDEAGWVGFDTTHLWDRWPDWDPGAPFLRPGEAPAPLWTVEAVVAAAQTLARAIAAAGGEL